MALRVEQGKGGLRPLQPVCPRNCWRPCVVYGVSYRPRVSGCFPSAMPSMPHDPGQAQKWFLRRA